MNQSTVDTQLQLTEFWRQVIDPAGIGMPSAIATDLASFTHEPTNVVLSKMEAGTAAFKELWLSQNVDRTNPQDVAEFYQGQFVEAYELANWHCGRTNGEPPLNYAYAALFAKRLGLKRALDFGSGIGSGSLALATVGCEVHSADIADRLLELTVHRLRRRQFSPRAIDLARGNRPRREYYDIITCFDVLEHVPDQLEKVRELEWYLRWGGYLLVNFLYDSYHEDRPMHVSSAGDWLRLIRQTSLKPDWQNCISGLQVLVRRRGGRVHNKIASAVDRIQDAMKRPRADHRGSSRG